MHPYSFTAFYFSLTSNFRHRHPQTHPTKPLVSVVTEELMRGVGSVSVTARTHTQKYILISWCMQDLIHIGGVSKSNQRPIPDELSETQRSTLSMERWYVAGRWFGFPNQHNAVQSQDIMHRSEPQSHRIKGGGYWVQNSKAWLLCLLLLKSCCGETEVGEVGWECHKIWL